MTRPDVNNQSISTYSQRIFIALVTTNMGLIFSKVFGTSLSQYRGEAPIMMAGLDATGKTTILYKLKLGETVTTNPTNGQFS